MLPYSLYILPASYHNCHIDLISRGPLINGKRAPSFTVSNNNNKELEWAPDHNGERHELCHVTMSCLTRPNSSYIDVKRQAVDPCHKGLLNYVTYLSNTQSHTHTYTRHKQTWYTQWTTKREGKLLCQLCDCFECTLNVSILHCTVTWHTV